MKQARLINIIIALLAIAECTTGANFNSIYREFSLSNGTSISIDAKQRVILVVTKGDWQRSPNGQLIYYRGMNVCAEPSPDALTVLGASVTSGVDVPETLALKLAESLSESGSNIGLRTQTIQLLRDSMYRLCEAYLSTSPH